MRPYILYKNGYHFLHFDIKRSNSLVIFTSCHLDVVGGFEGQSNDYMETWRLACVPRVRASTVGNRDTLDCRMQCSHFIQYIHEPGNVFSKTTDFFLHLRHKFTGQKFFKGACCFCSNICGFHSHIHIFHCMGTRSIERRIIKWTWGNEQNLCIFPPFFLGFSDPAKTLSYTPDSTMSLMTSEGAWSEPSTAWISMCGIGILTSIDFLRSVDDEVLATSSLSRVDMSKTEKD